MNAGRIIDPADRPAALRVIAAKLARDRQTAAKPSFAPRQPARASAHVSWAETHVVAREPEMIDRAAFAARAAQRRITQRYIDGKTSKRAPTRGGAIRNAYDAAVTTNMRAEAAERQRRQTDLAERARVHLQRRGLIVYRASVTGGDPDRWCISGCAEPQTDCELIILARTKGFTGRRG